MRTEGVFVPAQRHDLEAIALDEGRRGIRLVRKLVRRGEQPALAGRHRGRFAQAIHGAEIRLARQRQREQPVRLRVARGLCEARADVARLPCFVQVPALCGRLLVTQPRGLHVGRNREPGAFGLEQEVAGVGRAPIVAPAESVLRGPAAWPVDEAAIRLLEATQPRDGRAHVVLDFRPAPGLEPQQCG